MLLKDVFRKGQFGGVIGLQVLKLMLMLNMLLAASFIIMSDDPGDVESGAGMVNGLLLSLLVNGNEYECSSAGEKSGWDRLRLSVVAIVFVLLGLEWMEKCRGFDVGCQYST